VLEMMMAERYDLAECIRRPAPAGDACGRPAVGTLPGIGSAFLDYCAECLNDLASYVDHMRAAARQSFEERLAD